MIGAARRVAEVSDELRHKQVSGPGAHPVDEGRVGVVVADGNLADEVLVGADPGEAVRASELRVLRVLEQREQLRLLRRGLDVARARGPTRRPGDARGAAKHAADGARVRRATEAQRASVVPRFGHAAEAPRCS